MSCNIESRVASWSRRCLRLGFGVLFVVGWQIEITRAEDREHSAADRDEQLIARRAELMQQRVAVLNVQGTEPGFPTRFAAKPIFKYSDATRGYVAASVWKLGDQGRPQALMAVELNRSRSGRPFISYEYGSLTTSPFTVLWENARWSPKSTLYEFQPIPDAPAPGATPSLRLIQMRTIAKRFASSEVVESEKCELRLLPQPVDRYTPSDAEHADGAVMFFTFGTNPEVVLLIESDGREWSFAIGRMTGAEEVVVTLDNRVVWEGAPLQQGIASPYTGHTAPIEIPGIASDGRALSQ